MRSPQTTLILLLLFTFTIHIESSLISDVCKKIDQNIEFRAIYTECPQRCIVAHNQKWTKKESQPIGLDKSMKLCKELGEKNGLIGRMARFAEVDEFSTIFGQLIPNISFLIGAKRLTNGMEWHFQDYFYLNQDGQRSDHVDDIPSSFAYKQPNSIGEDWPVNSKCLETACVLPSPTSNRADCRFFRSKCQQSVTATVCELSNRTLSKSDNTVKCFTCSNGDLQVRTSSTPVEIVSHGYPINTQEYADCLAVVTSDQESRSIHVLADVGCLKHEDDYVELYQEKTNFEDAKLIARLRSGDRLQMFVPSKMFLHYHAASRAAEYSVDGDSDEIYVQPSKDTRTALKMHPEGVLVSRLSYCDQAKTLTPKGFKVRVSTAKEKENRGCPKLFHEANFEMKRIKMRNTRADVDLTCIMVVSTKSTLTLALVVMNAQLGPGDRLIVYDGYELHGEPIVSLDYTSSKIDGRYMTFSNVYNGTLTNRMTLFLELRRSRISGQYGSIMFEFRKTNSKFAKIWRSDRTRTRKAGQKPNGSWWHYWHFETDEKDEQTDKVEEHQVHRSVISIILFSLIPILFLVLIAFGFVAYYRKWPIFLRLKEIISNRKLL